jgi:hypothetical protein
MPERKTLGVLGFLLYTRIRMSTAEILFGSLFLLMALAIFFIVRIELRLKKLFRGSKTATLEGLIGEIVERVKALDSLTKEQGAEIESLTRRLKRQGRGVKLLRFNPFPEAGGNHSFAVGIVNEQGDGVVFSSLYSRDRMSVFAKPIAKGISDIELTPEEQSVVADAQKDASQ